jgi:hypothetical protein
MPALANIYLKYFIKVNIFSLLPRGISREGIAAVPAFSVADMK